jgi:hypothetical protein
MKLIYVAGPYATKTVLNGVTSLKGNEQNIAQARKIAIELWEMGHAVICPHLNTCHFERDCKLDHAGYLAGDFLFISKCDAVVMTPDWQDSKGATMEYNHAISLDIPVYVYPDKPSTN